MKFWPLNPYYERSDWNIWLSERFSEALTSKLWNKEMHGAGAYTNRVKLNYVEPPMVLIKIFGGSIQGIARWNSWEKIKLAIPHEQSCVAWLVKNGKTAFSKLLLKFLCQYYASRQSNTWPLVFVFQIFKYISPF